MNMLSQIVESADRVRYLCELADVDLFIAFPEPAIQFAHVELDMDVINADGSRTSYDLCSR